MATVLVADDSVLYLHVAGRILAEAGYEVVLARSGHEALDLARTRRPDVLLCDLLMPDGDGLETLRALKGDPALWDVPVYLLTGAEQGDQLDAAAAAADGVLTKPFDRAALLAAVGRHARP